MGEIGPEAPDSAKQSGWARGGQDQAEEAFPQAAPSADTEELPFLKRPMGYSTVGSCLVTLLVLGGVFVLFVILAILFAPDLSNLY